MEPEEYMEESLYIYIQEHESHMYIVANKRDQVPKVNQSIYRLFPKSKRLVLNTDGNEYDLEYHVLTLASKSGSCKLDFNISNWCWDLHHENKCKV